MYLSIFRQMILIKFSDEEMVDLKCGYRLKIKFISIEFKISDLFSVHLVCDKF